MAQPSLDARDRVRRHSGNGNLGEMYSPESTSTHLLPLVPQEAPFSLTIKSKASIGSSQIL